MTPQARLRAHLEALTFVEVQRLFMQLPNPKVEMMIAICDCADGSDYTETLLRSFEADAKEGGTENG